MTFERFIAKRFLPKDRNHFAGPLVEIATYSIALGVVVMIMAVSILRGFQNEISRKVVGFGSHIVVKSYELANAFEEIPISTARPEMEQLKAIPGVKHVQFFANKGGMLKTDDQIQGVIMKGLDKDFDTAFFSENLVEGRLPILDDTLVSNEVVISKTLADKLELAIGDKARTYFWQGDNYRARAFTIVGIYNTDLTDFDEHYMIGDLRQIQKINGWDDTIVAGYEILLDDFDQLSNVNNQVMDILGYDLMSQTIVESNLSLFSWLELLNSNIFLILTIMAIVCVVSIISALLIMIFEKTSMIGVLKTLGATSRSIREIFLIKAVKIITKGIVIGDLVAFALCYIQYHFKVVSLDGSSYSMTHVPIEMNLGIYLVISLCTIVVCMVSLLVPASYVATIDPAKTIKVV